MVLVKNLKYFLVFISVKIGQKNVFDDILERKKAFSNYENRKLKKLKNFIFPKRLVHGFCQKFEIYIYLVKTYQKNVFDDILERKKSLFRE